MTEPDHAPQSARILIVDDEPALRELVRRRLEANGFNTFQAEDGWSAIDFIRSERPDLVVLDLHMPGLDGLGVIRRVREDPEIAATPILVLSARNRPIDSSAGLEFGADDYLGKPYEFPELLARIHALLRRSTGSWSSRAQAQARGNVTLFVGGKGGVGTSTVAANVAYCLASAGAPTILADLTRFQGGASTLLGVRARRRIDRLPLQQPQVLTPGMVEGTLLPHPSGLRVLAGSINQASEPQETGITHLIEHLCGLASMVVLDLDPTPGPALRAAAQVASQIWVVTAPDLLAVERTASLIPTIEQWGVEPAKIGLVVCHSGTAATVGFAEIAEQTGHEPLFTIPAAPRACYEALKQGMPVAQHGGEIAIGAAFRAFATALLTAPAGFPRAVKARASSGQLSA